jgi:DNA-binding MarR family transcriptional regulator
VVGITNHVKYDDGVTRERSRATEPPSRRGGPADPDATALIDALAQSAFVVIAALTRIAAEHDLSLTQLRVFGILRDRRLRMAALADYLGLDKSTMSGLVDRAERKGLLGREKDVDDGRAVIVFITPAGLEAAARVESEIRDALAPVTGRLEPRDQQQLTDLLEQMLPS